jgi:predicted N-formylglutamate amidohydrolase
MVTWGSLISTKISEILRDPGTRFEDAPLLVVEKIETTAVPWNMAKKG